MNYTRRQFLRFAASQGAILSPLACPAAGFGQGMSSRKVQPAPRPKFSGRPFPVTFVDVAARAGLTEPTVYGERYVKRYIVEANGPGIAFFDYDQDGWLDIFVPSGTRLGGFPPGLGPTNHLYHNNRDGTFADVTAKAGLTHSGWCYGVSIGDYDNNGYDDLFLTYFGKNILYRNNGDGTFTDVTQRAGLEQVRERYGSGCTFIDYDRDGYLDLFVSRYIDLDLEKTPVGGQNRYCRFRGVSVNCGPLGLQEETCSLYHNNRDGTFTDVTLKAGIQAAGKRYGLTAVALDYNNDGWRICLWRAILHRTFSFATTTMGPLPKRLLPPGLRSMAMGKSRRTWGWPPVTMTETAGLTFLPLTSAMTRQCFTET